MLPSPEECDHTIARKSAQARGNPAYPDTFGPHDVLFFANFPHLWMIERNISFP
jgi:hypothetical protein